MVDLDARHDPDGAMGVFILMAADPPLTGLHCPLIGDLCWDAGNCPTEFQPAIFAEVTGWMHFLQDFVIFIILASGSITPGR